MHSHHGNEEQKAMDLFRKQLTGKYDREFPEGRISGDDDGVIAMAIAIDPKTRTIIIQYAEPTRWVGLKLNDAEQLRHLLSQKIAELKGMPK